ncbi:sigma-70 family RNA polymerase sigma factor [Clostridium chauvoei]|uniref:Sigma-70 family RNA polymerase sigma factor n=2 Tax=Clostridium chauvoei TaxID=46867 RepID=A0ABD4REJ3_9CLOT|nr:sigma-70 family RNA polymerase sigma factor [Clostridium chauvoei]ATD54244.1 hypothetical protein BTM20_02930 [Clostridium chauvoei]ATD58076.1 hypothetical protein BTM21_10150 [Clostridium chauvoei]MBX7279850.1 sigma-70 family RNA polymerase sigma factor [Clostridium chauvoei]MBX7282232.1 sigma-70 family RNA polymerase sigma factor [Clostridium chauvoei]MBX7284740.1 sigma-70 family RNA polymerase sigma factor [Clostridium chauvoei]
MDFLELLILAKKGNKIAMEAIIKLYRNLILKESRRVHLNDYTLDDIIQIGNLNIINAINKFNLDKDIESFPSYVFWAIRNGYGYLYRREANNNNVSISLNSVSDEGSELCDLLPSCDDVENDFISRNDLLNLSLALCELDPQELELITFLYLGDKKNTLTNYCKETSKDYYNCTCIKKRSLEKLKNFLSSKLSE